MWSISSLPLLSGPLWLGVVVVVVVVVVPVTYKAREYSVSNYESNRTVEYFGWDYY